MIKLYCGIEVDANNNISNASLYLNFKLRMLINTVKRANEVMNMPVLVFMRCKLFQKFVKNFKTKYFLKTNFSLPNLVVPNLWT